MTTQLATVGGGTLVLSQARPLDQNPAAVYLARLSPGSKRTMRHSLDSIANLVSGGRADALALEWAALRFQHTSAIRAKLAETYAPATAKQDAISPAGGPESSLEVGPGGR